MRDDSCGGLSLRLSFGKLGNDTSGSRLSIGPLGNFARGAAAAGEDFEQDRLAVRTDRLAVQVVETTAQAFVPDGRRTEGQRAVASDREATGVDGTGLAGGRVELKLEVRYNVCDTSSLIGENSVCESNDERALSSWASVSL